MMMKSRRLKRNALGVVAFLGATLAWGSGAEAHHAKRVLRGHLTTQQVDCDSLCTEGPLTGDLRGELHFTLASLDDTETPNVARYQGVNVIETSHGTLTGTDYGVWNLVTGEFVDYTEFTSGTGVFAGVHGSMSIMGVFDPVAGEGSSEWRAALDFN